MNTKLCDKYVEFVLKQKKKKNGKMPMITEIDKCAGICKRKVPITKNDKKWSNQWLYWLIWQMKVMDWNNGWFKQLKWK